LKLENGKYGTLIDCIAVGGHRNYGHGFKAWRQDSFPHFAILGPRIWNDTDLVRSFDFTFAGADHALFYTDHIQQQFKTRKRGGAFAVDIIDYDRVEIFQVKCNGVNVKFWMSVSRGGNWIDPNTHSTPTVTLEFERGVTIDASLKLAWNILAFFALSLGRRTRLRNVKLRQLSEQEISRQIEKGVIMKNLTYGGSTVIGSPTVNFRTGAK
jgi:hypothetical protein